MFEIPSTDSRGIPFLDEPSEQSSSATSSGGRGSPFLDEPSEQSSSATGSGTVGGRLRDRIGRGIPFDRLRDRGGISRSTRW